MRNPIRALIGWQQGRLEGARLRGRLPVFWFYVSMGLMWSLFMVASGVLLDLYYEGAPNFGTMQTRSFIYFVGGVAYGLVMWFLQEMPGTGRRDARR